MNKIRKGDEVIVLDSQNDIAQSISAMESLIQSEVDGISIFLIFVPLLLPIMNHYNWDPVWFGVILTLKVALGQFTPPLAVNLMVSCRIANVRMESTIRWVIPMLIAMFGVMLLVIAFPQLALWLPAKLGY